MDYYDTVIQQRGAGMAARLLADDCRKKDKAIEILEAENAMLRDELSIAMEKAIEMEKKASTLPQNIVEALNSGDGVYRP